MQPTAAFAIAATAAAVATASPAATLYDPALGTPPASQGWSVLTDNAAGSAQSVAGGRYRLDTTLAGAGTYRGNAISTALDTAAGFDLRFTLQLVSEAHDSANRAGYSVVMVGADPKKAIELSFWTNQVWSADYAAADPDRFVHGSGAAVDTTASHDWLLSVRNQQFTLSADGSVLLAGALRDYTAAGAPYNVANFLFFGDDSSRGSSVSLLGPVSVTAVPEPATAWLALAGGVALAARRRRGPWTNRYRGSGRGLPCESIAT